MTIAVLFATTAGAQTGGLPKPSDLPQPSAPLAARVDASNTISNIAETSETTWRNTTVRTVASVKTAPPTRKNPIITAWLLISKHFPNVTTVPTNLTPDGSLSVMLVAPNKPQYLSNLVIYYTKQPEEAPRAACSTTAPPSDVFNNCCFRQQPPAPQFSTNCLTNIRFEMLESGTPRAFFRIATYLGVLHLLGSEIARNSRVVPNDMVEKKLVPPDELLYVWNAQVDSKNGIITILNDELVDRIATTAYQLLPRMYFAVGSPNAGPAKYYQCSTAGIQRVTTGWTPQGPPSLVISRGQPVGIIGPPGQATSSSLAFYREKDGLLYFTLQPVTASANAGPDSSFAKFVDSIPDGEEAFPCMPNGTTAALKDFKNQFNEPETTVFYFYMFYLDAAFEEFVNVLELAKKAPVENVDLSPLLEGLKNVLGRFLPIPGFGQ